MEQGKKKKKGGCLKTALIILLVLIIGIVLAGFIWYKTHEEDIKKLNDAAHHDTLTGQKSPDFEVTTTDGETVSMSSLLPAALVSPGAHPWPPLGLGNFWNSLLPSTLEEWQSSLLFLQT